MELDSNKEIRRAVDTGKVLFGTKQTEKNVLKGNGKLIIISRNFPKEVKEKLKHLGNISQIPFYEFAGSGLTLGSVCGKPFIVGCMLVQDFGKSKVLELLKAEKPASRKRIAVKAKTEKKSVAKKIENGKTAMSVKKLKKTVKK